MAGAFSVPPIVLKFYTYFPLYTYPEETTTTWPSKPTLWVAPFDSASSHLSSDIECLKWQSYLALRGIPVLLRSDISPDGGVNGVLPSLHLPNGELLGVPRVPAWADKTLGTPLNELEGYASAALLDESRAWVTLFEGVVHSAILVYEPQSINISSLLDPSHNKSQTTGAIAAFFRPALPPLTGISTLIPPTGLRIPYDNVQLQYREAMDAASERLGNDTWLLGSSSPTALDAIMFAYLHRVIQSPERAIREAISVRPNLVEWEHRVAQLVKNGSKRA